jgi:sugar/nucleoside kinase (ribokinase family)
VIGQRQTGVIYVAGNVNVDLIMGPLAHWPRIGTETVLPHSDLRVGGQAGNTGLALAALGARHRVIANMGEDALGDWLRAAFPESAPHWPVTRTATTLTVGITHPGGERTFFTSSGHLAGFAPSDVLGQLPQRAEPGDLVLLCGIFLSPLLVTGGRPLFETLKERGFVTALDVGWPSQGWDSVRPLVESWLALADHVLFNEIETMAMAGIEDLDNAMQWFCERLPSEASLVVKRGSDGATAWHHGQRHTCPAPVVRIIDTIGAGDSFNAGYLLACVTGCDVATRLRRAVVTASTAISTSPRRYR